MVQGAESVPEILYHYTSTESFKKILESGRIRATRYDQMNDMSEVQLGAELLLKAVKEYETDGSTDDYKEWLIGGIESYLEGRLDIYVLSIGGVADSLGQWRAYARDGGIAIGFDGRMIQKGFLCDITSRIAGQQVKNPVRPDPGNPLIQCIYTDRDGNLDLRSIVAERFFKSNSCPALYASAPTFDAGERHLAMELLRSSLSGTIYRTICSIKHGAYRFEEEWRCINFRRHPDTYPVKLSDTNRLYIEMQFNPKEFVKEVWISPHGESDVYERAAAYLKQAHDLRFTIKRSKIPFRTS